MGAFIRRPKLNTPLWTIKYEFWGYLIIGGIASCRKNTRSILYSAGILVGFAIKDIYVVSLICGCILSDINYTDRCIKQIIQRIGFCLKVSFMVLLLYLIIVQKDPKLFRLFFAVDLFVILLEKNCIRKLFENKYLLWFSKYSFPVYVIHWPVICSLSGSVALQMYDIIGYIPAVVISFIVGFVVTIVLAMLFENAVAYLKKHVHRTVTSI